jgi:ATPase subunit of ABC transporter with duplicated ATPase domains
MIDINITNLVKSFDLEKNILDGVTFQVDAGERVGLLGKNGSGKSTLFKILTGELEADSGEVFVAPGRRIGLISQIPVYPAGYTVEDVLESAFTRLHNMEAELKELAARMAAGDEDGATLRRYGELSTAFEGLGGYNTKTELNKVAAGLSIPQDMRERLFDSLSGGEKTRVNLGRLILEDTDILLLDEPTNHLDLHATEWLEEYVAHFKGTVLTISHDRYFLDRTVDRVVELLDGKAEFYSGNYTFYAEEKERRYEQKLREYEKSQAKIEQLTESAEKMRLWAFQGNDKMYKRAIVMERRVEKLNAVDKPRKEKAMKASFSEREFYGDEVFSLRDVSMGFEGRTLFSGVDLKVRGGERIALLGDNGTGKSTFLKILLGEEQATGGRVKFGPAVKTAYLPQIVSFPHSERNLVDTMLYETNCSAQVARDRLAAFHFRGEDVFKSVSVLSGGELSRLKLCILMDEDVNFLILDEPTNHLDIASREWIEGAVEQFGGTLLFVSHDRYFINKFADRVWELEDGKITDYPWNFERYRQIKAQREKERPAPAREEKKAKKPAASKGNRNQSNARKQLTICERDIARAEERVRALDAEMIENACDYKKLEELAREKEGAQGELDALYDRWTELAEEAGE